MDFEQWLDQVDPEFMSIVSCKETKRGKKIKTITCRVKPRLEGEAKRSERVISEYPSYKIEVKRGEYNPFTTK